MTVSLTPPPAPIAAEEFVARQAKAIAAAADAGLDGLLCWASHTWPWAVRYLADYHSGFQQGGNAPTFGDKGFCALVLPVEGDPILIMDQRVKPGDVAVADARTDSSITAGAAAALRESGLDGGRLGVVGEGTFLDRHRREIEAALGHPLALVGADALVEPIARIKSVGEQALVRHASAVGSAWMTTMMEAVAPGLTEADLVSAGLPVLLAAGGWPMDVVAGSGNPCRPQADRGIPSFNSVRPLELGDLLRLDGFGPILGYGCDLARSTCVGREPTDDQRTVLEDAVLFVHTILDAMKPGVSMATLHGIGTSFLTERGHAPHGYFEGFWPAFGHQIGLSTEGPYVTAGEEAVLEPGMAMSIEIVMGTPVTGGISHEECVIVTADGVENITASCPTHWW
jgi:Xaa-Pro aminopeptidase